MENPSDFSKYNHNTRRQAEYFLQKYEHVFTWTDSEDILEIGCANGVVTKEVLYPFVEKHLKRLLEIDISSPAIDVANATNENSKIDFQTMNFGEEKEGDKYADKFRKIFAFYCFHLVKPAEVWPRNVYKMLKNNGQVFGTVVLSPNFHTDVMDEQLADINAPWNQHIQNRPIIMSFYGIKPIEAITKILTDGGFVVNAISLEEIRSTFEDKNSLMKTALSYSLFVKYVPEELKQAYLDDFLRRILKRIRVNDNGHHYYTMDVVSFVATKP